MQAIELTLVGKSDCHLCADARTVVARVLEAADNSNIAINFSEVDIEIDDAMAERFGEDIPVILINNRPHAAFHVYEDKLAYAILHERERMLQRERQWWRKFSWKKTAAAG